MRALAREAAAFAADLDRFGGAPPAPRFEQDWFPRLDLVTAYALARVRAPARIVEIGSGHSTRVLARAIADGMLATRLTAIDPAPRATLAGLAVERVAARVQDADPAALAGLGAGDFLFVDSSHRGGPGSDVELLLGRVAPALPPGALLHVHDVFLPEGYPASWASRGYNEHDAVAALLASGAWRVAWSSHWARTRLGGEPVFAPLLARPIPPGAFESSLWLERA
jgi:hypothetical protein